MAQGTQPGKELLDQFKPADGWRPSVPMLLLWGAIAFLFTIVQIQHSLHQGVLALPPVGDDVSYFTRAADRLQTIYNKGLIGVFEPYHLHSPVSTYVAFLGFLFFGFHNWAPAAMNGGFVFLLLLFVDYLGRRLRAVHRILLGLMVLAFPIVGHLVIEFRPDMVCGLATAGAVILSFQTSWVIKPRRASDGTIGALIALALLAKPSVFPITLTTTSLALNLALLSDCWGAKWRFHWQRLFQLNVRCLGIAVLLALPYYLFGGFSYTLDYIRMVVSSTNKDVWVPQLSVQDSLLFYLTGPGGAMMMGPWLYLWLILAGATTLLWVWRKERSALVRFAGFFGVLLFSYATVTIPQTKSPFLGVIVPSLILLSTVELLVYLTEQGYRVSVHPLFQRQHRSVQTVLLSLLPIGFLGIGASLFQWQWFYKTGGAPIVSASEVRYRNEVLSTVRQDLVKDAAGLQKTEGSPPAQVFLTNLAGYINIDTLKFEFQKRNENDFFFQMLNPNNQSFSDYSKYTREIEKSNYILTFSVGKKDLHLQLSVDTQKAILALVQTHPNFELMRRYPDPYSGGEMLLYRRIKPLQNVCPRAGIGPLEGPFPASNLPQVHWGLGPVSQFTVQLPAQGTGKLVLEGQTPHPNQVLTVKLGDRILKVHRFSSTNQFERIEVPVKAQPGVQTVELGYKLWSQPSDQDPRSLSVLYRKIHFIPSTPTEMNDCSP